MRFIIKLAMEAVSLVAAAYLYYYSTHQHSLSTRLSNLDAEYDDIVTMHNSRTTEPTSEALVERMQVAKQQAYDLYREAGCDGKGGDISVCVPLLQKRWHLWEMIFMPENDWDVYEEEEEAVAKAGGEAVKDL